MVRRVGFNDDQAGDPAPPQAEPAPDLPDHARRRGLRFAVPVPKAYYAGQRRPIIWVVISFLGFWLVGWTAGIAFAVSTLFEQSHPPLFLFLWLTFAVLGWLFGVWILLILVRAVRAAPKAPPE
ncbi:MAG: hypothetical protein OEN23_01080 [Paracoccaceae bacterium]|nr:hypothetical protein [Paracoccaceae bacterium]